VHIRLGDYLLKDKIEFGYNVATKQYMDDAIDYFKSKYNNTLCLVFTESETDFPIIFGNIKPLLFCCQYYYIFL
jgi:hypothetical protein